ncbi:MAG: NADH-quinone oxidoreductase subunit C [Candidatus Limnocylindria bacterium]
MARVRRSRPAAPVLGGRRPIATAAPPSSGRLIRLLRDRFEIDPDQVWADGGIDGGQVEIEIGTDRIHAVLQALRDEEAFDFYFLADLAAVDYGPGNWFEVVYHLHSDRHPAWLRIRTRVDREEPHVPSVTDLWKGAMFHEREAYDMMGIVFDGNRDLRRIFMSPDYRSFPQRRDFLLPDDAADSSAAGINPLERPETWDLGAFATAVDPAGTWPAADAASVEDSTTLADESRPR